MCGVIWTTIRGSTYTVKSFEVLDHDVKRYGLLFAALLLVLLLCGCWNGRILYSFEPPFWASIGGQPRLQAELAGAAVVRGYFPLVDVRDTGADPQALLSGSIASGGYSAAIVGPLLSFEWAAFVPKFPGTRFILIEAPPPALDPPRNAVFLTFDRTGAFLDAGRAAGESIRAAHGAADAPSSAPRIAILTRENSSLSTAEVDAFIRGAAEALDGVRPAAQVLAGAPDRTAVRAAVDGLRRAGAEVFLFGLGEQDPLGLEAIRDSGGKAIVSDWQVSGAFAAQVMLSVEADVPGGITRALDALRTGVVRVQGPVVLVSGKKI
jgi:hypothetical protein